jgi:hypothetical protein
MSTLTNRTFETNVPRQFVPLHLAQSHETIPELGQVRLVPQNLCFIVSHAVEECASSVLCPGTTASITYDAACNSDTNLSNPPRYDKEGMTSI